MQLWRVEFGHSGHQIFIKCVLNECPQAELIASSSMLPERVADIVS